MRTQAIVATCLGACVVALVAFVAHRRLAGTREHPGCASMIAFVIGWLAVLLAVITGLFLLGVRAS
jgi:hypothetical protein